MTTLNAAGLAFARSLIASGAVDTSSAWSFSAADGDALLGTKGADWPNYAKHHLGIDDDEDNNTKARWKYPFAKGGKLYRSALTAIRQRAAQQSDTAVFKAAGDLLDALDSKAKGGAPLGLEAKVAAWEYKFAANEPDGTFDGYGAVFGNEDDNGDLLLPGAFDKTLAQSRAKGQMPKMLLQHGGLAFGRPTPEDLIPIGKWQNVSPDTNGLQVKGRLINLDTESGKRIYGAMKEGELSGLSMGFKARDFTYGTKPNEPRRTLKTVDLMEISPVTFPANQLATIGAVKSIAPRMTIRDFETFLRDAGGFSHAAARAIAASGFKANPEPRDGDGKGEDPAALFRRLAAVITPVK